MADEGTTEEMGAEEWRPRPEVYRRILEASGGRSEAAAKASANGFMDAVMKLREEHGVLDLVVLGRVPFDSEPGEGGEVKKLVLPFGATRGNAAEGLVMIEREKAAIVRGLGRAMAT